ncbi:MAG: hypothetical protein QXU69_03885 [Thermofilaceae archaeon]
MFHEVAWTLNELIGCEPSLEFASRLPYRKLCLAPLAEQDI